MTPDRIVQIARDNCHKENRGDTQKMPRCTLWKEKVRAPKEGRGGDEREEAARTLLYKVSLL